MSEETKKIELGREGLYDARKLGVPKMLVLGVQHTFAMFGATVLVPILTGISVSTALLFAGIGTLLFHLLTKGKVPAFLGSSFAFLGGYAAVAPLGADGTPSEMLPYAAGGIVVSGLIYVILSALIKVFGVRKIMRFFPPVVTGPIIISIGLILAPSAITNCQSNWLLAFIALAVIVVCNIWGKGMVKILPILIGIVVSYIAALFMGNVDFTAIQQADWFGLAIHTGSMAKFSVSACITIAPIALATMMEHIGDIAAISCKHASLPALGGEPGRGQPPEDLPAHGDHMVLFAQGTGQGMGLALPVVPAGDPQQARADQNRHSVSSFPSRQA